MLPRGSTPRCIRERVEFLKLACLQLGRRTVYYFSASEAYNTWRLVRFLSRLPSSSAFAFRWEDQGDWCSSSCLWRLSIFLPTLKRALITQFTKCTSAMRGEDSRTTSSYTLCTPTEHSFLPSPDRETCSGVPVRPQSLSSAVFSCTFTCGQLEPWTCSSTTPSSV